MILQIKFLICASLLVATTAFFSSARAESESETDYSSAEESLEGEASELDAILAESQAPEASLEGDCVQHTIKLDRVGHEGDCDNRWFFWGTRTVKSCQQFGKSDPGLNEILNYYANRGQATDVSYRCNGESAFIRNVAFDTCTVTICANSPAAPTAITSPTSAPTVVRAKLAARLSPKVFNKRKRCALRKRFACKQNRIRFFARANGSCCLFGRKR